MYIILYIYNIHVFIILYRMLKAFSDASYLRSEDGIVLLWSFRVYFRSILQNINIYSKIYRNKYIGTVYVPVSHAPFDKYLSNKNNYIELKF